MSESPMYKATNFAMNIKEIECDSHDIPDREKALRIFFKSALTITTDLRRDVLTSGLVQAYPSVHRRTINDLLPQGQSNDLNFPTDRPRLENVFTISREDFTSALCNEIYGEYPYGVAQRLRPRTYDFPRNTTLGRNIDLRRLFNSFRANYKGPSLKYQRNLLRPLPYDNSVLAWKIKTPAVGYETPSNVVPFAGEQKLEKQTVAIALPFKRLKRKSPTNFESEQ